MADEIPASVARSRARVAAIATGLAAAGFIVILSLLASSLSDLLAGRRGVGTEVSYTFSQHRCAGTAQFRSCGWTGTVRDDDGAVLATDVAYRDEVPANVTPGTVVTALWSPDHPQSAYEPTGSDAWATVAAAAVLGGLGAITMAVISVLSWRRFRRLPAAADSPPVAPSPRRGGPASSDQPG